MRIDLSPRARALAYNSYMYIPLTTVYTAAEHAHLALPTTVYTIATAVCQLQQASLLQTAVATRRSTLNASCVLPTNHWSDLVAQVNKCLLSHTKVFNPVMRPEGLHHNLVPPV